MTALPFPKWAACHSDGLRRARFWQAIDVRPIARGRDRLDSRHHVEHRTSCRSSAPIVPLHLRARSGSRPRLAASRRRHRRVQRRSPRRRGRPAAAGRASAHRASARRASAARGRRPRASPHQAHVRRLSSSRRRASRAPAGRADGAAARARTGRARRAGRWAATRDPRRSARCGHAGRRHHDRRCRGSAALPIHLATLPSDPETAGARRSAWLAVFFAAACALVTIAEYRGAVTWRSGAREAPPVPADVTVADVQAPQVHPVRPPAAPTPATAERAVAASPARPIPAPTPKLARAPEPRRPWRRRLPGRASRSPRPGARSSRPVRSRRT